MRDLDIAMRSMGAMFALSVAALVALMCFGCGHKRVNWPDLGDAIDMVNCAAENPDLARMMSDPDYAKSYLDMLERSLDDSLDALERAELPTGKELDAIYRTAKLLHQVRVCVAAAFDSQASDLPTDSKSLAR